MKDFLRQNGLILLVIALLLSVLIGISSLLLSGGTSDPFSSLFNTVTSPVRSGTTAVMNWVEGVYTYVFHYDEMNEELETLRIRVAELEKQVRDGEDASRENERLRDLLNLQAKREDFSFESATITARSASNWESRFTLNKGSTAGVSAGNCVISQTGVLVGVISEVGLNWSTVSTVLDADTEIGGVVARTYSAGVLEGDFSLMRQGRLKLNYLPDGAQLIGGDEVLTSGKGNVYPAGLVVGQVEGIFTDPSGQTRYAVIQPRIDLDDLLQVFIIKEFNVVE